MADVKISQLPAATTPVAGTEVLPIVQSGTTSQVSINTATGITRPFTSGGVVYASSASALATGSALTFDGANLGVSVGNINLANSYFLNGRNTANTAYVPIVKVAAGDILEFGSGGYNANFTGNVGIGTSAPASILHVVATAVASDVISENTNAGISSSNKFGFSIRELGTERVSLRYFRDGTGNAQLSSFGPLLVNISGSERARIDGGGNLLVGTTSGSQRLTVAGNETAASKINAVGTTYGSGSFLNAFSSAGGNDVGFSGFIASQALDATNRLWAGVHSPSASKQAFIGTPDATPLTFWTNSTECARIDSYGNLLVGTTASNNAPSNGVQLWGSTAQTASGGLIAVGHVNGSSSGNQYHTFAYNGGIIGSISQSGTTAVLYNTTSDYRLKTVTGAVTGQGARIDALKPIDYLWTEGGQQARGFLAHEFQTVYPSSVTGDKDAVDAEGKPEYQSMQAGTAEVIADLVAEIKSLRQRVAQLETN